MSLSPLYKLQTSDLHVNTASAFHQSFLWLRPELVKVTHLSGPIKGALMNPPETIRVSERVTIFFAVLLLLKKRRGALPELYFHFAIIT